MNNVIPSEVEGSQMIDYGDNIYKNRKWRNPVI